MRVHACVRQWVSGRVCARVYFVISYYMHTFNPAVFQVNFTGEVLYQGLQADALLAAFNRKLMGRDAVVIRGDMHVSGLPAGFL